MRRFHEAFRAAPQTHDFFAFLKGTDGLLHLRGPERLHVALESLDHILRDIRAWCGAETEIVLFSDHGMNLQENRRVNLQTHLRLCGYTLAGRGHGQNRHHVTIPAFGLCGYAALYCIDEEAPQLAGAVAELEGVDFTIYRDGGAAVVVKSSSGAARNHRRESERGVLYRYEQIEGDPLHLSGVVRRLGENEQLDKCGYAADRAWYKHTGEHVYPDALANLYSALHTPRVRHTADVLVSMRDGYYYGVSIFSRIVRIAATHGNALRASSSAFLMSTHRALPATVRASEVRPLLRD